MEKNELTKRKKFTQVDFAAQMFHEAFPHKAFEAEFPDGTIRRVIWLRGIHYYIVSLPLAQRQIPTRGKFREYLNTRGEYQNLSELLVNARLRGLVDDTLFWDNRNDFMIEPASRKTISTIDHNYRVNSGYYFSFSTQMMQDYDDFVESIEINPVFRENRFANQMYEIIVVTEKLTVKAIIKDICMKYGANCLAVKGQSSFTRVTDICRKAKKTNRPILLLGIYDLDCAGWDMGYAFTKRMQQKYPHEFHKFERVGLLREQAEQYNLPSSFEPDDKGYPEVQKQRFYEESGGTTCIELDAMDNIVIKNLLEEKLKEYSCLKLDKVQERRFKKREKKKIREIIDDFDFSPYESKYNRFYERYSDFYNKTKGIRKYLRAKYNFITDQLWEIEKEIKSDLSQKLNGEESEE